MNFEKLTSQEKEFYFIKVKSILLSEKLFLKTDFSLPELAQETGIQLHTISYLINSENNINFNDYINLMRIEYFKERINCDEWKDLKLKKMILSSGFKCRTTCYRAFIKHTGVAPSKYLKLNRI